MIEVEAILSFKAVIMVDTGSEEEARDFARTLLLPRINEIEKSRKGLRFRNYDFSFREVEQS